MSQQPQPRKVIFHRCFSCGNVGASHSSQLIDKLTFDPAFLRRYYPSGLKYCKLDFKIIMDYVQERLKLLRSKFVMTEEQVQSGAAPQS